MAKPIELTLSAVPSPIRRTLVVVGSPDPGQRFAHQFVSAAKLVRGGHETIWLVEKSGYELARVPLDFVGMAPPGGYGWITSEEDLVAWINRMPNNSIASVVVFSHGYPGIVTLRNGWAPQNKPNYGLGIADIARINPGKFTDDATIAFNSCNSASLESSFVPEPSGGVTVEVVPGTATSQTLANHIHRRVSGWTGRTSYFSINRGGREVLASTIDRAGEVLREGRARLLGRWPVFVTYGPTGKQESESDRWSAPP